MGECETYVWASKEVAAINHFNNRMKNYSDEMGSDGNIAYCKRGNGIVLASFNGAGSISISSHGLADGTYTDEVSGNMFTVSDGVLSGTITSEYGIAVIYRNVMPNPSTNYPVQISNNKADGTTYYTDTLKVTLSESYATTASYEASTGESGTFSGTTTIEIGEGLEAGDTLTLTVTATNSSGALTKTYTYYKDEYDLTDCIFFENTNGWEQVTAYLWNDEGAAVVTNASWPGESMYQYDEANNIYALKIDTTAEYNKVIFSNNGASQTADLEMGEIGYLYHPSTGTWTEYVEAGEDTESGEDTEAGEDTEETPTITTGAIYLNVSACSWFENDSAVPAIKTDVDDGYTEMTSFVNEDGEKIYTVEISTEATTASIVRMLPNGNYYNELVITVNNGSDYFVGNSSWSQVTEGSYVNGK